MEPQKPTSGKSITTSVPSFAIRFHAEDEELEEIYPSADETDDDAEKQDDATALVAQCTTAGPTVMTISSSSTAASSRDPSPMKEYLKGLGKRSTSVDAGIIDTGSGSDTWRIFHELKGKITKTVEEKFSEMKSDRKNTSSTGDTAKSVKSSVKNKDSSSISDSEDISEASNKVLEQKTASPKKVGTSVKKFSMEKALKTPSSSLEEKENEDKDTSVHSEISEEGSGTPVVTEINSFQELAQSSKRLSFPSKIKSNISGLRQRSKSALDSSSLADSVAMSTLVATNEDMPKLIEDDVESGVEASEDIAPVDSLVLNANVTTTDYRTSAPSTYPVYEQKKKRVKHAYTVLVKIAAWKFYIIAAFLLTLYVYIPVPIYFVGFINGTIVTLLMVYLYNLVKSFLLPSGNVNSIRQGKILTNTKLSTVPILEVQPVREYQALSKYSGWMNEYSDAYDPATYHIAHTQSVFVRLEGSTLRLSHPRARIPKRAMWNERSHRLRFSHQRIYNIAGCECKLLPEGLARKRLWSKKYPITIILKNSSKYIDSFKEDAGEEETLPSSADQLSEPELDSMSELSETAGLKDATSIASATTDSIADADKLSVIEDEDELSAHDEMSEDDTFCHVEKPTFEETCLYLFARTDREKEDWFRRFSSASSTTLRDLGTSFEEKPAVPVPPPPPPPPTPKMSTGQVSSDAVAAAVSAVLSQAVSDSEDELIVLSNDADFSKFMSQFEIQVKVANGMNKLKRIASQFPNYLLQQKPAHKIEEKLESSSGTENLKEKEIIDGPCEVMWVNSLFGRVLFDILSNKFWILKIQERIQKKLSTLKLPFFLEELLVTELEMGQTVPLIQKASHPTHDERGLWVDLDISYEGIASLTLETKLNLMKLKKLGSELSTSKERLSPSDKSFRGSPMFDSELDDSAESSDDESDAYNKTSSDEEIPASSSGGGTGKKILRMVNKIAASRYFQQATEYKYIKKAMEGVSNKRLILSVELKGLSGTLTLNIPPPPSDRLWYGFRGNPNIWLSARPKFGERQVNIGHVVSWIEKKLIEEFQKKFVLPNMDDLVIGFMNSLLPGQINVNEVKL